jgi:protein O-GlcNAc transferase
MTSNIQLYKNLFREKKFGEIIDKIEKLEQNKSAQILHILGICKMLKNDNGEYNLSARENFREAFIKEKNTDLGIEALTNFININTGFFEIDDSLKYYSEIKDNFPRNLKLLKAISRLYQFSVRIEDRKKVLEEIIKLDPSSLDAWCSYIYINNFSNDWNQEKFYLVTKAFSKNIKKFNFEKLDLDKSILKRKIKIAFFSSDIYHPHSITYFLNGLLKNLDKNKFEIYAISSAKEDKNNEKFKKYFNSWYNINNLNDYDAINFLREKKIDILFDLMGFTGENRISILKNKVAPIQISWLGYCNTSGIDEIDYILADHNLILEEEEKFYSEKVIKLEKIWNAHEGFEIIRKKLPLPAINNKHITFGSFNNFNKISDQTLKTWSIILKNIKDSKLLLKSSMKFNLQDLKARLNKLDISDKVIIKSRSKNFEEHLNYYEEIDLVLDTFPYNGVTTTFEAIWKGVPVLTVEGYNFNSRCGSSIIKNLGIKDLIAKNEDDYISKAIFYANNLKKLANIRSKIFETAIETPLFNTKLFTKNFEKLINYIIVKELK